MEFTRCECTISVIYFLQGNYIHYVNMGYLISALNAAGYNCNVYSATEKTVENIAESLCKDQYNIVFIHFEHGFLDLCKTLCEKIKSVSNTSTIILFNKLSTSFGQRILEFVPELDIAIRGEYDRTVVELCDTLISKTDIGECRGIWFKDVNHNIKTTAEREVIDNLDVLPFPERSAFPHNNLFHIIGSRGCEGHCTFCSWNCLFYNSIKQQRFRSVHSILCEVDYLVKKYGCKYVGFSDATFCATKERHTRLNELYTGLKDRDYFVQFFINLRSEQIDGKIIKTLTKLAKVGLGRVFIGIESLNSSDLSLYGKIASVEDNMKAISLLSKFNYLGGNKYEVDIEYGFILFNPYTTIEDLYNNISTLQRFGRLLTPNVISSLECNYTTKITKKIDSENLLVKHVECMNMDELTSLSYAYYFVNHDVCMKWELLLNIYLYLNIVIPSNFIFLRNRYYHFNGYTDRLKRIDDIYLKWRQRLSDFCYYIIYYVLDMDINNFEMSLKEVKLICDTFLHDFTGINNELQKSMYRLIIELTKDGEMVYE